MFNLTMFKKLSLVFSFLALFGCGSFNYESRPFFYGLGGEKTDCLNGRHMMSFELCRLDSFGY